MRDHPDDAAFLNRLAWTIGEPCDYGKHPDEPTVKYGADRICRADLSWRLHLERCHALDTGQEHTPTLTPVAR